MMWLTSSVVRAHELDTDESIGAVMHIDPSDDPIVNQPSTIYFDVKDTTNTFSSNSCECAIAIIDNGQKIVEQSIHASDRMQFTYSFPHKGPYTITLSGKPLNASFKPFTLSYDVLITKEVLPSDKKQSTGLPKYVFVSVFGSLMLIVSSVMLVIKLRKQSPEHA